MKKLIIIFSSIAVILLLAGIWYWQTNYFSKGDIKLEILGPDEADVFEEVEYTVKYKNNGSVTMESPTLIFEFPEHTLAPGNSDDDPQFSRRQELGPDKVEDIYPGVEKTIAFKGRIFGKENDVKTAKAYLKYKPKGLNASYESSTTFSTKIKQIQISFDFDLSSKIEAGRDFKFSVNYFSNLDYPVANLSVKMEYPSNFEFISSVPKSLEKTEWDLPTLNKANGGRIDITGRLMGTAVKGRIFSAALGVWEDNEFVPLKEISKGVDIGQSQIDIFQRVNGSDNYTALPGDLLHYEVFFRNLSSDPFSQLFMVVKLNGSFFDINSLKSDTGQVGKGDSTIIFDWRNISSLGNLNSGEEGKVEFWVNVKSLDQNSNQKDFTLKDSVQVAQTSETFEIKLGTRLTISQKVLFNDEAFGNTGVVPPKVGEPTTFTVNWEAKNYYSNVKNVTARATLPSNVRLTGKFFPEDQSSKFTFDSQSREIVWRVSDGDVLPAGTGVNGVGPNISFQVELTPDASQRFKTAQIIGQAIIRGEDQWTNIDVEGADKAVDTTLPDDNNILNHSGLVQ